MQFTDLTTLRNLARAGIFLEFANDAAFASAIIPVEGYRYFNTTTKKVREYINGALEDTGLKSLSGEIRAGIFPEFANDAAFASAITPAEGYRYFNTTTKKVREYINGALRDADGSSIINKNTALMGGRLTLSSGLPIVLTDQSNKTTIYYTPFSSKLITLYNGTEWEEHEFSELSLSIPATTNNNVDVFIYNDVGTITVENVLWTNTTTRSVAITKQDGIDIKSGSTNKRLLGTYYIDAGGYTHDSFGKRFVHNLYNQIEKTLIYDLSSLAPGDGDSWYYVNGNSSSIMECVISRQLQTHTITTACQTNCDPSNKISLGIAVGIGNQASNNAQVYGVYEYDGIAYAEWNGILTEGYNQIIWVMRKVGGGSGNGSNGNIKMRILV